MIHEKFLPNHILGSVGGQIPMAQSQAAINRN